jgi:hypothetical protein
MFRLDCSDDRIRPSPASGIFLFFQFINACRRALVTLHPLVLKINSIAREKFMYYCSWETSSNSKQKTSNQKNVNKKIMEFKRK